MYFEWYVHVGSYYRGQSSANLLWYSPLDENIQYLSSRTDAKPETIWVVLKNILFFLVGSANSQIHNIKETSSTI